MKHPPLRPVAAGNSPNRRSRPLLIAMAGVLIAAGGALWLLRPSGPPPHAPTAAPAAPVTADFVGSGACASCHAKEHAAWTTSQHARAMQHATAETVRGDFNDATFTFDRVTSRFFRRDGKFFVRTDGPDGKLADFEVKYTFGLEPLQQYLVELPGGRLQALAVSWDARPQEQGGQRWFRQYPDEKLDFRDELALDAALAELELHVRRLPLEPGDEGLRRRERTRSTRRYKEIAVGCEACHGPGSAHMAWAKEKSTAPRKGLTVQLDERRGVTWSIDPASGNAARSRERTGEREIEVCAQCHARRAQIAEGYRAGAAVPRPLPAVAAGAGPLYHVDGQQRDEVFIWGSWLQSRMHRQGVTCSDCHDPHSQKLRVDGNAVCGQCHAPGKYDAPAHHRHKTGSAGAQCADCHMPKTTYMVVDGRRDHSHAGAAP